MTKELLYPYQEEAIGKMSNGCILCGGVGSGKSRTALAYYFRKQGGEFGKIFKKMPSNSKDLYVITTARKRDTEEWGLDMAPFLLSNDPKISPYNSKVIVDSWNNIGKYDDVSNAFFIFDEQRVVGSGAWVKSFLKIAKVNEWILLSATPGDTWIDYIPVFIANGFYKNRTEFLRRHVIFDPHCRNFPKIDRYIETGRLIRLRSKILVNMDFERPTTSHHQLLEAAYDITAYKKLMRERWNEEKNEPITNASELCYQLRKIVNSDTSRQELLLQVFLEKERVIVFYNFDYELDILKSIDYGKDVTVSEWNGHKHQPVPDSKKWIYLVQYTAGSEGWNCVRTNTIFFFSQTYSYRTLIQSAGRIDRLNTPYRDLYYYHVRSKAPIDLAIAKAQKEKKNFNAGMFVSKQK